MEELYRFHRSLIEDDELCCDAGRNSLYILGESARMQGFLKMVRMAARDCSRILIRGESGTGKGEIADVICHLKGQSPPEFLVSQSSMLRLELFGYMEGVYFGKIPFEGALSRAAGGTVILYEIEKMAADMQAALVPVLQTGGFRKLGDHQDLRFDGAVISIMNKNLSDAVKAGRFRGDLYDLLNQISIEIPPLRVRSKYDLEMLVQHILRKACNKAHLPEPIDITCAAMESVFFHTWPGNLYELKGTLRVATARSRDTGVITKSILEDAIADRLRYTGARPLFNSSGYIN